MRALWILSPLCGAALLTGGAALAHEAYMDCFDNGDDTVTCVAGYEDGSPPTDRDRILIKNSEGKTIKSGNFDEDGAFNFGRPEDAGFMMIFMGSEIGHTIRINAGDLVSP